MLDYLELRQSATEALKQQSPCQLRQGLCCFIHPILKVSCQGAIQELGHKIGVDLCFPILTKVHTQ
jgi:hypothetical protein